jgi:hypothetical protein
MEIYDIAGPAIVAGLVQVTKKTRIIASRWLPIVSLAIGVTIGVLVDVGAPWQTIVIRGLFYGLSAVGLYETQKEIRA